MDDDVSAALTASRAKTKTLEDQLAKVYEHLPVGFHDLASDGTFLAINDLELSWLGRKRIDVIGRMTFQEMLSPASKESWSAIHHTLLEGGVVTGLEVELIGADGLQRTVLVSSYTAGDRASGQGTHYPMVLCDVSESIATRERLRIMDVCFESQQGFIVTDAAGMILRVNSAFCTASGYGSHELVGMNPRLLHSGLHDKAFYAAMWESLLKTGSWQGTIWNRRKDNGAYAEHLTVTAVRGARGVVTHYVGAYVNIALNTSASEESEHLAFYDALTHLPNRRLLMDRLKVSMALSSRAGHSGALLLLDIDNFRSLNETLGHSFGDELVVQVARRLDANMRAGDTVARMGGDEFVVILEELSDNPQDAAAKAEVAGSALLSALGKPYGLHGTIYRCTASMGAVVFAAGDTSSDHVLKQADIAMYQAKKAGGNVLRFFDPEMQTNITARVRLEDELQDAISLQQFELFVQPQVGDALQIIGAEALLRWRHPVRGLVLPGTFIGLAEETGQIVAIGQWVLDAACKQLLSWQGNPLTKHLTMAVNVSARQLRDKTFVTKVQELVSRYGIDPRMLILEPTESMLLEDVDETVLIMRSLSEIGVRFSLDDFGTGFSSLQYLKQLPLHQIKIAQVFIRDLLMNFNDHAIVRTIVAMAKGLNLDVIAEGVETEGQLHSLLLLGCPNFQGFLFGKPIPVEEFTSLLRASRLPVQVPAIA
jgi:diguanylate cyclase (GGDEF)-like protein/PAS domain S-box-containing protein